MNQPKDRLDAGAMGLMVLLCAVWGLNQVSIKFADGGIAPVLQAGLRSSGAAALLWLWAQTRGIPLFARDGVLGLSCLLAVLFAAEFVFLYSGMVFTNASHGVLFLYMAPFFVALGAHFFTGEELRPIHLLGLGCAFAGLLLASADSLRLPTYRELLGDGLELVAASLWGATTVLIKATKLARISAHRVLFYQLLGSAPVLLLLSAAMGERGAFAATPAIWGAVAFQTVIVAFISYLAWFKLISLYPVFRLSAFSFLTPLFGMLAGGLILGEPITVTLMAAMVLVGCGIYLINRDRARKPVAVQV
ncbi:MAG: DMT family transporter [Stellaceae bacterium]|jgi:drug/metabolite transporter (DMT)-like permease